MTGYLRVRPNHHVHIWGVHRVCLLCSPGAFGHPAFLNEDHIRNVKSEFLNRTAFRCMLRDH